MAPSFENYEEATSGIPVKVLGAQIDGTVGAAALQLEEADKHDQVLRVFRCLIADLCEQFGGGHPGGMFPDLTTTLTNEKLIKVNRCHGHGSHWCIALEVCHEVFSSQPQLLQQRPLRSLQRPHMSVPIHLHASGRVQEYDH